MSHTHFSYAFLSHLSHDWQALRASSRTEGEGVNFCNNHPLKMRIDGAVLLTGATGFVGGGILFSLLARASELGVTKIVLMIRQRSGKTLDERVAKLRDNPMFDGLRETFDKLVVGLEGDVSQRNFGWKESSMNWPHKETLKVAWDLILSSFLLFSSFFLYHPYVQFTLLCCCLRLA